VDELARHLGGIARQVVEGGHDGEDGGPGFVGEQQVAQMDAVEGRLAHAEDEAAALLEADVGGAFDEVGGHAIGDAGQRPHGAGQHDHSIAGSASAGNAGADVGLRVLNDFVGGGRRAEELFDQSVATAELHLFGEDAQSGFTGDEFDACDARVRMEGAQHLGGEDRAAGAGDGQSEAQILVHKSDYLPWVHSEAHPYGSGVQGFFAARCEVA
jgi:hypothetical protein